MIVSDRMYMVSVPFFTITGRIYYSGSKNGTIYIELFSNIPTREEAPLTFTNLSDLRTYTLVYPSGTYYIAAYMDVNGDGHYNIDEPFGVAINKTRWSSADKIIVNGSNVTEVDITLYEPLQMTLQNTGDINLHNNFIILTSPLRY